MTLIIYISASKLVIKVVEKSTSGFTIAINKNVAVLMMILEEVISSKGMMMWAKQKIEKVLSIAI